MLTKILRYSLLCDYIHKSLMPFNQNGQLFSHSFKKTQTINIPSLPKTSYSFSVPFFSNFIASFPSSYFRICTTGRDTCIDRNSFLCLIHHSIYDLFLFLPDFSCFTPKGTKDRTNLSTFLFLERFPLSHTTVCPTLTSFWPYFWILRSKCRNFNIFAYTRMAGQSEFKMNPIIEIWTGPILT